jgi:hypothetical protein
VIVMQLVEGVYTISNSVATLRITAPIMNDTLVRTSFRSPILGKGPAAELDAQSFHAQSVNS